jgi:hypothetical protein
MANELKVPALLQTRALLRAALVISRTHHICGYLTLNDPKALEQLEQATSALMTELGITDADLLAGLGRRELFTGRSTKDSY